MPVAHLSTLSQTLHEQLGFVDRQLLDIADRQLLELASRWLRLQNAGMIQLHCPAMADQMDGDRLLELLVSGGWLHIKNDLLGTLRPWALLEACPLSSPTLDDDARQAGLRRLRRLLRRLIHRLGRPGRAGNRHLLPLARKLRRDCLRLQRVSTANAQVFPLLVYMLLQELAALCRLVTPHLDGDIVRADAQAVRQLARDLRGSFHLAYYQNTMDQARDGWVYLISKPEATCLTSIHRLMYQRAADTPAEASAKLREIWNWTRLLEDADPCWFAGWHRRLANLSQHPALSQNSDSISEAVEWLRHYRSWRHGTVPETSVAN